MAAADLILVNADIFTMDARDSRARALAARGETLIAVGEEAEIRGLAGPKTEVIDAGGRVVLPGFIDAHCHLLSLRGQQLLQADCSPARARSIGDLIRILKEEAARTPRGQWVQGGSYDHSKLAENRHPTRRELDRVSTEHPVHLRNNSCHMGVLNSLALERAGITRETPDPPGGVFERDADGELTGICREEAHFLFVHGMGTEQSFVPAYTTEELKRAVQLACRENNSVGITSVGDALVNPQEIGAYQEALQEGLLTVRVYMIVLDNNLPRLEALQLHTGLGSTMLKLGALKSFVDGATAGHTAWLSEPYEGRPEYYGIATKTPEQIEPLVLQAHRSGLQIEVHANGDRAIEMVLDAYEKAQAAFPRSDPRHRIAHCTVVTPAILRRLKALGVVALPFSTYVYEHGEKFGAYGKRVSMMFAHRSFLDHGIPVAGSSDNPCATQDPFIALQSMVTRKSSGGLEIGPEQKVSVMEALRIYTMGSAYASFEEGIKGSLEPGKLADFVVVSEDPTRVAPERLKDIRALKTVVGGKVVYDAL